MSRSFGSSSFRLEHMFEFDALTLNQKRAREAWDSGNNLVLSGSAGTGKTFLGMYFGLEEVLDKTTPYDKLIILRSIVPTRDIGFLPGDETEKKKAYTTPYIGIAADIMDVGDAWDKLNLQGKIEFVSTSFIRGTTYDNCILLVDEMQNLNFHELDSVITRAGDNCKMIFCGDYYQSDFDKEKDKQGLVSFLAILEQLNKFEMIEFTWKDIVRSDFVRDYIMTKEMLNLR